MIDIESELFSRIVKRKSISHPTARNFDPEQWKTAAAELTTRTSRDQQLLQAGLFYGTEIKRLRDHFENKIFAKLDQKTGILLTIAMANLNHRILEQKSKKLARKRSRTAEIVDPLAIARQPITGPYPQNHASADAIVATIVDTIPHCLERAFRLTNGNDNPPRNFHEAGSELFAIMSIEHSLRCLWQQVLWDGWQVAPDANDSKKLRHSPTDHELAALWDVWVWRQEMITFQGTMLDDMNNTQRIKQGHFIKPFIDPTVVGIGGHSKESRRFRFGSLSGREHGQAWHMAEQTILSECYLADFLETPLPKLAVSLSCNDLLMAWRILRDCASVLAARCKEMHLTDIESVERHSLLISRAELERAIGACTKLSKEQIGTALNFLTCDPNDLNTLFNRGVWASPIVAVDGNTVALTLPAILVGSAIRLIESWLDRGGLSDLLPTARRGMRHEAWVRAKISDGMKENPLLPNGRCYPNSIDRRNQNDEQIDLLILPGNTVIVGEVKCLLAPIEPIEHYNYLSHLKEAGRQASRKARWLAEHPAILAEAFHMPTERARLLRNVPIIVVNQGAGLGLLADGVRVVDFHFLNLYLSEGGYHSGTSFNLVDGSAASSRHKFYSDEQEAESKFTDVMANPPTLQRFINAVQWTDSSFPRSTGQNLVISTCSFREELSDDARALGSYVQTKKSFTKRAR